MSRHEESYSTPFGVGRLVLDGDLPLELDLPDTGRSPSAESRDPWCQLLRRYFDGEPVTFDLDLGRHAAARRLTPFETDVMRALSVVPYGTVVSYGELAAAAGHPGAQRAVGTVMAANQIPILLPCHRVILAGGRLGRYGDDPAWKARLLTLEGLEVEGDRVRATGGRRR